MIKMLRWLPLLAAVATAGTTGCASQSSYLVPTAFTVDANNLVSVTLQNQGEGAAVLGKADLKVFVNGDLQKDLPLSGFQNAGFVPAGGTGSVSTGIRIAGAARRFAAWLDPTNQLDDLDYFQRRYSKSLDSAAAKTGPDFTIDPPTLGNGGQVTLRVRNAGNAASSPNQAVTLHFTVDGTASPDWATSLPQAIQPGGFLDLGPSPALNATPQTSLRAILETASPQDELDTTNDSATLLLPTPTLAPYLALLQQPKYSGRIWWEDDGGATNYAQWGVQRQQALQTAIMALENNQPLQPSSLPAVDGSGTISGTDAWNIFLAHIAHSLWLEVHHAVGWSLVNLPDPQAALILDGRTLVTHLNGNRYLFDISNMGAATSWNPRFAYQFMTNFGLVQNGQMETIWALIDWARGRLVHAAGALNAQGFLDNWGYAGAPPVERMLYPAVGKPNQAAGCWGTSGLLAAVLRAVNIPAQRTDIQLDNLRHSRIYFPSVDQNMIHGDDIYTQLMIPSGTYLFATQSLHSTNSMNQRYLNQVGDCVNNNCNSPSQQTTYNQAVDTLKFLAQENADFLLNDYAQNGANYTEGDLTGYRLGGQLVQYVKPYFDAQTRAAMLAGIQQGVQKAGGGNYNVGAQRVMKRFANFNSNKNQ